MSALLALVATILTSFLPILNKRLLRDARPALVAWVINAASLPILALGTLLLTQCSITSLHGGIPFSCTAHIPQVDGIFVAALLASALLNWAATLLSTVALAQADASLVSPLLTFNPAFTLLIAWPALGEIPGLRQTFGVAVVLFGTYLLEVEEARAGLLAPIRVLLRRPGTLLAILASALWGTTTGSCCSLLAHCDSLGRGSHLLLGEHGMGSELIHELSPSPSCLQESLPSSDSRRLRSALSGMSRPFSSSALSSPSSGHGCSSAKASCGADCLGRA